jgi:hypothetical protein
MYTVNKEEPPEKNQGAFFCHKIVSRLSLRRKTPGEETREFAAFKVGGYKETV